MDVTRNGKTDDEIGPEGGEWSYRESTRALDRDKI
jgi:hypothetical protein